MIKNPSNSSINIYKVEEVLPVFLIWAFTWYKKRVIIYIDSIMAISNFENFALQGLVNTLLYQILLLAAQ